MDTGFWYPKDLTVRVGSNRDIELARQAARKFDLDLTLIVKRGLFSNRYFVRFANPSTRRSQRFMASMAQQYGLL